MALFAAFLAGLALILVPQGRVLLLSPLLMAGPEPLRAWSVDQLSNIGEPSTPLLGIALEDRAESIGTLAVAALKTRRGGVDQALMRLEHDDDQVRRLAHSLLLGLSSRLDAEAKERVVATLIKGLRGAGICECAITLGSVYFEVRAAREGIPKLIAAMRLAPAGADFHIATAIGNIAGLASAGVQRAAIVNLQEGFRKTAEPRRVGYLRAIGSIGRFAKEEATRELARRSLEEAQADIDPNIQKSARAALSGMSIVIDGAQGAE